MRGKSYSALVGVVAIGAACSRRQSGPSATNDAATLAISAAAAARPADAASGKEPLVDLILETDSKVKVSSRVDNPHDWPEHLIDGRPETAWNSRTGDLNGWIEVELPAATTVKEVAITAGFDRKKGEDDLFTMNHRIKKVRITRDGKLVKEATLDTKKRELQRVAVDEPGGKFRIDVLETEPGTKKEWKELVVSDFKMFGHPGKARLAHPRAPKVEIAPGSAPPPQPVKSLDQLVEAGRTGPSRQAICDAWWRDVSLALAAERKTPEGKPPWCRLSGKVEDSSYAMNEEVPVPPFEGTLPPPWKAVHAIGFDSKGGSFWVTGFHLVFERGDGTVVVGPEFDHGSELQCPGSMYAREIRFRFTTARGKTILVGAKLKIGNGWDPRMGPMENFIGWAGFEGLACPFDGQKPICKDGFIEIKPTEEVPLPDIDKVKLVWPTLDDDGRIVATTP
jgi:hypothetical protein